MLAALDGLVLDAIWCTHHHFDHVGGVPGLLTEFDVPVIGSAHDLSAGNIPGQTVGVRGGDTLEFRELRGRVHDIPGHTLGAVALEIGDHLFPGDTLFCGGCGRVFEGTMPMMRASLAVLRGLDPALRLWCGHEYTVKNLEFALEIADEPAVAGRLATARALREAGRPTVGTPLALELDTNPFLRWDAPTIRAAAARLGADPSSPDEVFGAIRHAKDRW